MGCLKLKYYHQEEALEENSFFSSNALEKKSIAEKKRIDAYRYGFNGMERDDEMKGVGNSWNYKFRMYDPRLGRFFSVDPLAPKYPFYSPYQFAGNSPISNMDIEGLEPGGNKFNLPVKNYSEINGPYSLAGDRRASQAGSDGVYKDEYKVYWCPDCGIKTGGTERQGAYVMQPKILVTTTEEIVTQVPKVIQGTPPTKAKNVTTSHRSGAKTLNSINGNPVPITNSTPDNVANRVSNGVATNIDNAMNVGAGKPNTSVSIDAIFIEANSDNFGSDQFAAALNQVRANNPGVSVTPRINNSLGVDAIRNQVNYSVTTQTPGNPGTPDRTIMVDKTTTVQSTSRQFPD